MFDIVANILMGVILFVLGYLWRVWQTRSPAKLHPRKPVLLLWSNVPQKRFFENKRIDIPHGLYEITKWEAVGNFTTKWRHEGVLRLQIDVADCIALDLARLLEKPSCEHYWHHSPDRDPEHIASERTLKAAGVAPELVRQPTLLDKHGDTWTHWWGSHVSGMIALKCLFCSETVYTDLYYDGSSVLESTNHVHTECLIKHIEEKEVSVD